MAVMRCAARSRLPFVLLAGKAEVLGTDICGHTTGAEGASFGVVYRMTPYTQRRQFSRLLSNLISICVAGGMGHDSAAHPRLLPACVSAITAGSEVAVVT